MTPEDEHKRIRERERGLEAERITNSDTWREAWEVLANGYNEMMLTGTDAETLEAKRCLHVVHRVRQHFDHALRTGEFATQQLEAVRDGRDESTDGSGRKRRTTGEH